MNPAFSFGSNEAVPRRCRDGSTMSWVIITIALTTTAALSAGISQFNPNINLILICSIALVLVLPVIVRLLRGTFDPFEPIVAFVIMYTIFFVVRPLSVVLSNTYSYTLWFEHVDISSSYTEMLVLSLLGAIAFMIGYEIRTGDIVASALPNNAGRISVQRLVLAATVVAALGIFLYAVHLQTSGRSIFSTLRDPKQVTTQTVRIAYLSKGYLLLVSPALCLIAYGLTYRHRLMTFSGSIVLLVFLFLVLASGSRLPIIPVATGLLILVYVLRGRRPTLLTLLAFLLVGLIGSAFVLQMRSPQLRLDRNPEVVLSTVLKEPRNWVMPLTEGPDNQMSDMFAVALQKIPATLPYKYGGATVGEFFIRPIPRAIWANKPPVPNKQLTQAAWPNAYEIGIANPEYTILTHFYWDFGAFGVFGGMLCYGVLSKTIYCYFKRHSQDLVAILYLGVSFGFVAVGLRNAPVDNLVWLVFMVAPIWFIFSFSRDSVAPSVAPSGFPPVGVKNGGRFEPASRAT